MKKSLPLYLILLLCCTSPKRHDDQVKVFLAEWSKALTAKDESARRYYDARFVFPDVLFEAPGGFQYNFDINHVEVASSDENGYFRATVPFTILGPDGKDVEHGKILLTIATTEAGFLIRDMTRELATKLKEHSIRLKISNDRSLRSTSQTRHNIFGRVLAKAAAIRHHYDTVVFFTAVASDTLYYVVNGSWQYPYSYNDQRDSGDYQMGVVTARNEVVIPVEYDKVYNPNGSFPGMIEVERNGLRGLFSVRGGVFIPAEFDGIYPTEIAGAFAQVKQGEKYGWVDHDGNVSFDPVSHANKGLFASPIENNAILEWEFRYPGDVNVLINPYLDVAEGMGVVIYPSYIKDLGISPIASSDVMLLTTEYGMGMTDTVIKFEKLESLSDKLFGLVSFFMEAGADAREYHTTQNDLLVVDKSMNKVDHVTKLTKDYFNQDPCGARHPQYKTLSPGLYESKDIEGNYKYYQITADGTVEELESVRQYNFTKFAKMDGGYFERCRYEQLKYEDGWESGRPNLVVVNGLTPDELDVMRNEIFAEYGYIFKSAKWKAYFQSKPWYKPQFDNVDHLLTEIDKYNINFILEYQKTHKGQNVKRDSIEFMWAG